MFNILLGTGLVVSMTMNAGEGRGRDEILARILCCLLLADGCCLSPDKHGSRDEASGTQP